MLECQQSRKKRIQKQKWKKEVLKMKRHKSKKLPMKPTCKHEKKPKYSCTYLTMQDVRKFHEAFYKNVDKISQDNFILKHIDHSKPKRSKVTKTKDKQVTIKYYIQTKTKGLIQVCSKAFLGILDISRYRVINVGKNHMAGESPKERRGGFQPERKDKYEEKRRSVKQFIKSLNFVESHYCRHKTKRYYLPSHLTLKRLWRVYNQQVNETQHLKVTHWLFRDVFMYDFNISFKIPATDVCSTCIRNSALISTSTGLEKVKIMTASRIHKLKANAFYNKLKQVEKEYELKLSFDCQKNLILPKVPDQSAYFSRQLYMYNLTICRGHSKGPQNKDTVTIYTWTEDKRAKGSNEVASILYHHISTMDLTGITEISLFSDGAAGQNKNMIVLGMLGKLLYTLNGVLSISITFPIVGHSYLPADRVFGRIEKEIRKKDTIILPDEYMEIFQLYGTVRKLGEDVPVHDWKTAVAEAVRPPGKLAFKFLPSKRILLKKVNSKNGTDSGKTVMIKGEVNYLSDLNEFTSRFLKVGKKLNNLQPNPLPLKVRVKPAKMKDVDVLLKKHFSEDWRKDENLHFYKSIIDETEGEPAESECEDMTIDPDEENQLSI